MSKRQMHRQINDSTIRTRDVMEIWPDRGRRKNPFCLRTFQKASHGIRAESWRSIVNGRGVGRNFQGKWMFVHRQSYWEVAEVPMAAGPYRTWRMVRVQGGNIDPCGSHFIEKDPFWVPWKHKAEQDSLKNKIRSSFCFFPNPLTPVHHRYVYF